MRIDRTETTVVVSPMLVSTRRARASTGRATIRDVADRAGVSVTTVSRVLGDESDRVKDSTREAVLAAIRDLDFVLNPHARALAGGQTKTVAFLVSEMVGPSFAQLAAGVESVASERGYLFMMCTTHSDEAREGELISLMREQRTAAVLLVGAVELTDRYEYRISEYARELAAVGSRLVLCGRPPVASSPDVTSVDYDNFGGGYAITRHLLELGHTRILFLGARDRHSTSTERLRGHQAALAGAGIPMDERLVPPGVDYDAESAAEALERTLQEGLDFTAVIGVTDFVAVGAMRALRARGLRIPEDVSVAGFDDIPLVADLSPALTTVQVPFGELGRQTARLALPGSPPNPFKHVVLPVSVQQRDSTGLRK